MTDANDNQHASATALTDAEAGAIAGRVEEYEQLTRVLSELYTYPILDYVGAEEDRDADAENYRKRIASLRQQFAADIRALLRERERLLAVISEARTQAAKEASRKARDEWESGYKTAWGEIHVKLKQAASESEERDANGNE